MKTKVKSHVSLPWFIVGVGVLVALWQLFAMTQNQLVAPTWHDIINSILGYFHKPDFYRLLGYTLINFLIPLISAIIVGFVLGILMAKSQIVYSLFFPFVGLVNSVPPISWLGLAFIWFGLGAGPARFLVFITLLPILAISVINAYQNLDPRYEELAQIYGMKGWKRFRHIVIPQFFVPIRSVIITMIGLGWKIVIMGEFLSSTQGWGKYLFEAKTSLETSDVIGLTLLIICIWAIMHLLFKALTYFFMPANIYGYSRENHDQ